MILRVVLFLLLLLPTWAHAQALNDKLNQALQPCSFGYCMQTAPSTGGEGSNTQQKTVASGLTTNTTSTAVVIPSGPKSFYGQVTCASSTCTQTQAIFGNQTTSTSTGILLCTLTLSAASPSAQDACPVVTANFAYYYVTTTNTGGGGTPTGAIYAMY